MSQTHDEARVPSSSASPTAAAGAPVFELAAVTKTYKTGGTVVRALREVDLVAHEGELSVLLGPSGSGKSTLLNIVGGLDRPTSGSLKLRGEELSKADDRRLTRYRRDQVGFIFQFYNVIPSLTARENVALVTEIAADPLSPEEALALVGLEERMDHFPAELSGGEQQRVAVARAIAKRPDVLLCDEPTGALDSATGVRVLEAIERVNREMGATTMVITHNVSIGDMADRVLHFADGRITRTETPGRVKAPGELVW